MTRSLLVQSLLLLLLTALLSLLSTSATGIGTSQELLRGFTATPSLSASTFQPLIGDSSGNYSLGFLRISRSQLTLAVIHVPSLESLWTPDATQLAEWSTVNTLSFNGSLVISGPRGRVLWSNNTEGDRVWLSNTSNLIIETTGESSEAVWQSFQFPTNTLMENQNFTSAMSLVSSNGLYSMRLGSDYFGMYANFEPGSDPGQIYFRHRALEAKASVVEGQGPIYVEISADGFLGMYQNGSTPVDIEALRSYQQPGSGNRRLRIEPDGNLKGYYWTGSGWILDYQAISDPCELPSACGSYGLCKSGQGCSCLDNRTAYSSGACFSPKTNPGDFCGIAGSKFRVLRRAGVELPYKELMGYERMGSAEQCEGSCQANCTCWGAVYTNSSGFCYIIGYPVQTLLAVGDDTKVGYFKVRTGSGEDKVDAGIGVGVGLTCGAILVFGAAVGLAYCSYKTSRRGEREYVAEEVGVGSVGPYKNLSSASHKSIELCER